MAVKIYKPTSPGRRIHSVTDYSVLDKKDVVAVVKTIEYDPTRTAFISLLYYRDGIKRYMLTPQGLKVGDKVMYGETAEISPGNRLALKNIPVGTLIHDIELAPGQGGKMARSAGAYATLQNTEAGYALLKLPSGEIRKVRETSSA